MSLRISAPRWHDAPPGTAAAEADRTLAPVVTRRHGRPADAVKQPRRAAIAVVSTVLFACFAGAGAASAAGVSPAPSLSAADQAGLTAAYAAFEHIPASDVGAVRAGSAHVAAVGGTDWATAAFAPAAAAPASVQARFQDGGSIGVFTRQGGAAWTMTRVGGEPFPCGDAVPAAVQAAWGLASPAACASSAVRAAPMTASPATGTTATVASVALSQVGRGDTPVSTSFSFDCDAYTTLVGAGASSSGCGTDPNFGVLDENEEWCSDFAKWVWEQAGVTSDLSVLTAGATTFATWAKDEGESTTLDAGTPAVGDAVVFYPPGTSTAVGTMADHVGLVVGVDASTGDVELVNGDFGGGSNIDVQNSGYVNLQSFANAVWDRPGGTNGNEEWVFVSPKLPAGASSPISINAAGNDVAFVNTSGQVVHDWGTSTGWAGPAAIGGTARADSPIVENSAGTLVAFIDTSGDVVNDWANSTGWHGPAAIGGTARAGSPLAMNAAGNDVAFVNTSGQVSHDWGTSTGWAGPATIGGTARADSPLTEDDNGDTVVFFNTAGAVVNDWATSTGWAGPAAIGGTAEAGSPLATDDSGRDVVFVNTAGQVVNDWGTSTAWNGPAAIGGTARADSPIAESGTGGDVVYINTAGAVVNDWGTTNGWAGPAAIGGTARAGSQIAESDSGGTVVYINTSGQVVNDWGTTTGWNGPAAIGGTSR